MRSVHHALLVLFALSALIIVSACAVNDDHQPPADDGIGTSPTVLTDDSDGTGTVPVVAGDGAGTIPAAAASDAEGAAGLATCPGPCGGWTAWQNTSQPYCTTSICQIRTDPPSFGARYVQNQIRYRACWDGCLESQTRVRALSCSPACL